MKRLIISIMICLVTSLAILCGCADKVLARPPEMADTSGGTKTLEFWVGEKVEKEALGDHSLIVGMFGGFQYFGKEYYPEEVFDPSEDSYPEVYVTYTLTAYSDYFSGESDTVTRIKICDPAVMVYGITCTSSVEEFSEAFSSVGCKVETSTTGAIATYGKTTIVLTAIENQRSIGISVEVTNKTGMIF